MTGTAPELGNLFTPEFVADPYPTYKLIREANPVFNLPDSDVWGTTRYDDCVHVLRSKSFGQDTDQRMRKDRGEDYLAQPAYASLSNMMLLADPPDHSRLRKLVVRAFDARNIESLRERIRGIAAAHVDKMLEQGSGEGDLMQLFAHPIPVVVICEMLGIPVTEQARFVERRDNAGRILDPTPLEPDELNAINQDVLENNAFFEDLCEQRRKNPQDDLLTLLVQSETEDGKLSREELTANIFLLFGAGHETTVNLMGNGLLALYRNRDQLEKLKNNFDLMPNAIEELLRYDSSVQLTGRNALEDTEISGHSIPKGSSVITLVGAGNRDPEKFANPDVLDIEREKIRPISFGGGIHMCLGAQLARIEAAEAFKELLTRLPNLELTEIENPNWRETITLRGLVELPVTW